MKTEAKKKTRLSTVPEAALEEAGLAKETILAAIPMDGTITQDPVIRKAVDDIVYDFYGEENPCREEDYNLTQSEEMQMGGM